VAVALPEEMPVNETLEYRAELEKLRPLDGVVVNGLYPERFTGEELGPLPDGPAVRAARTEHGRFASQRSEVERLEGGVGDVPLASLPFLFVPELGLEEVSALSESLEEQLA
jgi:hypothetical protein